MSTILDQFARTAMTLLKFRQSRHWMPLLFALGIGFFTSTYADTWPSKPVKIIVPYGPGGAVDVITRKVAQKLSEQTGQSFFVENKAGATGTIGAQWVAKSDPDGYTLMANDTTYALLPHIFKKLPFDHGSDLVPISAFAFTPMAIAVNSNSKYKTLRDLVNAAKAQPNSVSYGSGGAGTTPHFASEAFGIASGANFLHIPFKGAAEATQALLSGTIDMQIASTSGLIPSVRGGRLRVLALSGDKHLGSFPNVPTFSEAGVPWAGVVNWTGLWAPKGTPSAVLNQLQKEVAQALASSDMKAFAEGIGADPRVLGTEAFARMLKDSTDSWAKVASNTAFERQ
jgi:tripartite-type tricarboxylate transporter receptor subunit TctC